MPKEENHSRHTHTGTRTQARTNTITYRQAYTYVYIIKLKYICVLRQQSLFDTCFVEVNRQDTATTLFIKINM